LLRSAGHLEGGNAASDEACECGDHHMYGDGHNGDFTIDLGGSSAGHQSVESAYVRTVWQLPFCSFVWSKSIFNRGRLVSEHFDALEGKGSPIGTR
jgi:hypothetical protein